jgi:SAM-dependent methyltransferase
LKTSREKKTPVQALTALHESASLRALTGPSLRPGGFLLTERGLSLCGFDPGARIVDVGCGTGASVAYLRKIHRLSALGFDVSGDLFQKDGSGNTISLAVARAEKLPLPDASCDGVLCECVLSLVPEPKRAVEEFSRILRIGGFLIMSDIYDRAPDNCSQSGPEPSGGCSSSLRLRHLIEKLLEDSEFGLQVWEDHTRYLKELAAQLILSNESLTEFHDLCGVFDTGCKSLSCSPPIRPGYYLLVAQKMKKGDAFYG